MRTSVNNCVASVQNQLLGQIRRSMCEKNGMSFKRGEWGVHAENADQVGVGKSRSPNHEEVKTLRLGKCMLYQQLLRVHLAVASHSIDTEYIGMDHSIIKFGCASSPARTLANKNEACR